MNPFSFEQDPGDLPPTGPAQAPFSVERVGAPDWLVEQQRSMGTQPPLSMDDWQTVLSEEQARRDAAEQAAQHARFGSMTAAPEDARSRSVDGLAGVLMAAGIPWTSAIPMARAAGAGAETTAIPDATRGLIRGDAEQFATGLAGVAGLGIPAAGALMKSPLGRMAMGGSVGGVGAAAVSDPKHPSFDQGVAGGATIGALLAAAGGAGGNAVRGWQAGRQQQAQTAAQAGLNARGEMLAEQLGHFEKMLDRVTPPGTTGSRGVAVPVRKPGVGRDFSEADLVEMQAAIDKMPARIEAMRLQGRDAFEKATAPARTEAVIPDLRRDGGTLATARDPAFRPPSFGDGLSSIRGPQDRVLRQAGVPEGEAARREAEVIRRAQERQYYQSRARIDDETPGPSGLSPKGLRQQQEKDLAVDKHVADATGQLKDIAGLTKGFGKSADEANGQQARFLAEHLAKLNDGTTEGARALVDSLRRRGYDLSPIEQRPHVLQQRGDDGRFLGLSPEARKLYDAMRSGGQKAGGSAQKSNRYGVGDDF